MREFGTCAWQTLHADGTCLTRDQRRNALAVCLVAFSSLSLYIYLSIGIYLSIYLSIFIHIFVCIEIISIYVCYLSISFYIYIYLYLSMSIYVYLYVPIFLYIYFSISVYLYHVLVCLYTILCTMQMQMHGDVYKCIMMTGSEAGT